ncbi:MAG: NAD(P)/FAD-dependent oxidoreductase [Thermoplasmata archaeon]|nr:MAG: NAD(P)/FAD-dependent oxidoreductase [Thermoplasmata archaeon]
MKMDVDDADWDVVVVGGGPAGSSAARAAAEADAAALLIDRRETIGIPVQCAEFLARKVVLDQRFPREAIAQDVERSKTFLREEEVSVRRNPGCILNRDVADKVLWDRARSAGAETMLGTRVTAIEGEPGGLYSVSMTLSNGDERTTTAALIIGADGPRSTVGAAVGISNHKMVVANQVTVPLNGPSEDTEVYLAPVFAGGYAWMFPKGDLANVGVGVDVSLGASPMRAMAVFLDLLGDRIGDPIRSTGGLIPVGGPLPMRMERTLLAGDAAGLTHPITGGGIHQALESGRLAGEAAAAFVHGDEGALERYEPEFLALFDIHLGRAHDRRRWMVSAWEGTLGDAEAFDALARRTWIGFKEYYRKGDSGPDDE